LESFWRCFGTSLASQFGQQLIGICVLGWPSLHPCEVSTNNYSLSDKQRNL